ncbi:DUF2199 domain-containing protein [Vannielia litorea]|uniref:DUF2199 domain-containing protein n=1 Tax=Vannielia litorea TaxID=1217970 RepID=A0A1N6FKH6_9RHOB|nr:DUF2199 domain-containing protein [Vannielia litorea]SIN95777.1 hypothetical protein SAMN05444002_1744 [Vannielia litorea]
MAFHAPQWFSDALTTASGDPALDRDPRWPRFLNPDWRCPCCGIGSPGLADIGFDHPAVWPHGSRHATGEVLMQVGRDRLTSDLCRYRDAHFIRCILPVPITGYDGYICFGPWARVAREHFEAYAASTLPPFPPFDGCEAMLANDLPGSDPRMPVPCLLTTAGPTDRPALFAEGGGLRHAQQQGLTFDSLLEIYAALGTDLRGHLDHDPEVDPAAEPGQSPGPGPDDPNG